MKRINNWLAARVVTTSALCVVAADSMAHGGHPVPAGVHVQHHWHLFEQIVVSAEGLIAVGVAVVLLVGFVINKRLLRSEAN